MKEEFTVYIRENLKKFSLYFGLILLVTVLFLVKEAFWSPYVYDSKGNLKEIKNSSGEQIQIHLKVEKEGKSAEEDAVLDFNRKKKKEDTEEDEDYELSSELERVLRYVESQGGKRIRLPVKGKDGLHFSWSAEKNYKPLLLPFLYPLFLFSFFYGEKEKEKREEKEYRSKIKKMLPGFSQQIVLLMNSGLVFSDAFEKIARGYGEKKGKKEPFEELIITINEEAGRRTESLGTVLSQFSYRLGHREFSRLVAIITEHEFRGSDLREKLMDESRILWEERKKDAEAAGKTGETKLSFPLGILLVVLILVTAAPAVLEM